MNKRIDNLEFRATPTRSEIEYELVQWQGDLPETCIVVAFFDKGKEGYNIRFIGDRPFQYDIDRSVFWSLLKFGQTYCDALFELDDYTVLI